MKPSTAISAARLRRFVQAACLALFCLLLVTAGTGGAFGLPADLFLRMDPLTGLAVPIAARQFIAALLPALAVIVTAVFAGRIFCGWICPMGTTLDAAGKVARLGRKKRLDDPAPRRLKYALLGAALGAAALGVNVAFWASPISLVTRLYALVLHPLALLGLNGALSAAEPLIGVLGSSDLQYWSPALRGYRTAWFVGLFWLALFLLERVRPRFWCRYLCPAGALLGLSARLAPWRRRTGAACNSCGKCAAHCPAGIPAEAPSRGDVSECLTCRACEAACTKGAVYFGLARRAEESAHKTAAQRVPLSRRAFCGSVALGAVLAGAARLKGAGPGGEGSAPGNLGNLGNPGNPVRPPGSLPEADFLARCVRCGECMKACPTGGLQPVWLQSGFSGMFSPALSPRSGPCDPECAACGAVCPSGAIPDLPLAEKRWAKIGTAVVDRKSCIAWAEDKRCMVCQETCPYGAVKVVPQEGHIAPAPVVRQERCYGCGFCEKHCPTARASIRVEAHGALRLAGESFETAAKAAGLELDPTRHDTGNIEYDPLGGGAPPGFLE